MILKSSASNLKLRPSLGLPHDVNRMPQQDRPPVEVRCRFKKAGAGGGPTLQDLSVQWT
jgi:hypothetical protein